MTVRSRCVAALEAMNLGLHVRDTFLCLQSSEFIAASCCDESRQWSSIIISQLQRAEFGDRRSNSMNPAHSSRTGLSSPVVDVIRDEHLW